MNNSGLIASRAALVAIKGIAGDALIASRWNDLPLPSGRLGRFELACRLGGMQHAALIHYLRCDASASVLLTVRSAVERTIALLDADDADVVDELTFFEPYRHHLYTRVLVTALLIGTATDDTDGLAQPASRRRTRDGRAVLALSHG